MMQNAMVVLIFMKYICTFLFMCCLLPASAYEYVYCEDVQTHEWQWLFDDDGEAVWVHGHVLNYQNRDTSEVYEFGSMPVSKRVFERLHERCVESFGSG